jgi:hypothetical protein
VRPTVLAVVLCIGLLAGCGGSDGKEGGTPKNLALTVTPSSPTINDAVVISFSEPKELKADERYRVLVVQQFLNPDSDCPFPQKDFRSSGEGHMITARLRYDDDSFHHGKWCPGSAEAQVHIGSVDASIESSAIIARKKFSFSK